MKSKKIPDNLPIVDADDPPENEDWILSPEKRARELALFDRAMQEFALTEQENATRRGQPLAAQSRATEP